MRGLIVRPFVGGANSQMEALPSTALQAVERFGAGSSYSEVLEIRWS